LSGEVAVGPDELRQFDELGAAETLRCKEGPQARQTGLARTVEVDAVTEARRETRNREDERLPGILFDRVAANHYAESSLEELPGELGSEEIR
jgi:hypothetical protein